MKSIYYDYIPTPSSEGFIAIYSDDCILGIEGNTKTFQELLDIGLN